MADFYKIQGEQTKTATIFLHFSTISRVVATLNRRHISQCNAINPNQPSLKNKDMAPSNWWQLVWPTHKCDNCQRPLFPFFFHHQRPPSSTLLLCVITIRLSLFLLIVSALKNVLNSNQRIKENQIKNDNVFQNKWIYMHP